MKGRREIDWGVLTEHNDKYNTNIAEQNTHRVIHRVTSPTAGHSGDPVSRLHDFIILYGA